MRLSFLRNTDYPAWGNGLSDLLQSKLRLKLELNQAGIKHSFSGL